MSSAMNEWKSTHLTYSLRQKAASEWMMANKQNDAGRHLFRGSFRAELKQQYGHFQLAVFLLKNSMRSARASDLHEYMAAHHSNRVSGTCRGNGGVRLQGNNSDSHSADQVSGGYTPLM